MFIILMLFMFHYYNFSAQISEISRQYYHKPNNFLETIFELAPFTFSSIFSPIGGILFAWIQKRYQHYIFPYLFLVDSMLSFLTLWSLKHLYIDDTLYIAMVSRVIQGLLLGGMIPQYVMFFYARSRNMTEKVHYGNLFFILFYLAVIVSIAWLHFMALGTNTLVINLVSTVYLIGCISIIKYKPLWHNFHIEGIKNNHSTSLKEVWSRQKWTIIRFNCFITFMSSINSFFASTMAYYLIYDLNYKPIHVYTMQLVIITSGIIGIIIGGMMHELIGRKFHLTMGLIIKLLLFVLFRLYLKHDYYFITVLGSIMLFCVGMMVSKLFLILNSIFNSNERLYGIAITYNMSWSLMFGCIGLATMLLINHLHNLYIPSMIIITFSYISLVSLWFTPNEDFFRYIKTS